MPHYYKIKLNIDKNQAVMKYFTLLLDSLNKNDKELNAVLMKGKEGYEIFAGRPLSQDEKSFLNFSMLPLQAYKKELSL